MTHQSKECLTFFVSGVGLGMIIVVVLIAFLAAGCQSGKLAEPPAGQWKLLTEGTTIINAPCVIIVIDIKANTDRTVYFWRIGIIPKISVTPTPIPRGSEA